MTKFYYVCMCIYIHICICIHIYILEIGPASRDTISSVSRVGVLGVMGGVAGIVIAPDGLQKGGGLTP